MANVALSLCQTGIFEAVTGADTMYSVQINAATHNPLCAFARFLGLEIVDASMIMH